MPTNCVTGVTANGFSDPRILREAEEVSHHGVTWEWNS